MRQKLRPFVWCIVGVERYNFIIWQLEGQLFCDSPRAPSSVIMRLTEHPQAKHDGMTWRSELGCSCCSNVHHSPVKTPTAISREIEIDYFARHRRVFGVGV